MVHTKLNDKFLNAIEITLKHEGGYVNHPNDPGGETKFGITKRSYTFLDIRKLTKDEAINIYFKDYWAKFNYHLIDNDTIRNKVFDMGVLMGPRRSILLLQRALLKQFPTLEQDSMLGNITSRCVNELPFEEFYPHLLNTYWSHFEKLIKRRPESKVFENGWKRRVYS
jgi:lysozyme family protein